MMDRTTRPLVIVGAFAASLVVGLILMLDVLVIVFFMVTKPNP